jgi:hypothetical protein
MIELAIGLVLGLVFLALMHRIDKYNPKKFVFTKNGTEPWKGKASRFGFFYYSIPGDFYSYNSIYAYIKAVVRSNQTISVNFKIFKGGKIV